MVNSSPYPAPPALLVVEGTHLVKVVAACSARVLSRANSSSSTDDSSSTNTTFDSKEQKSRGIHGGMTRATKVFCCQVLTQLQFVVWSTIALLHLVRAAGSLDPDWTGLEVS